MARIPTLEESARTSELMARDWLSEAFPDPFAVLNALEKILGKELSPGERQRFARICFWYSSSPNFAPRADDLRQAKRLVAALQLSAKGILREARAAQALAGIASAMATPEGGRKLQPLLPSMEAYQRALSDLSGFASRTPRVIRIVEICHRARNPAVEMIAMWNRIERGGSSEAPLLLERVVSIAKQRERRLVRFLKNWKKCVGAAVGPPPDTQLDMFIVDLAEFWVVSGLSATARWNAAESKPVGPFSRVLVHVVGALCIRPMRCASDEALVMRARRVFAKDQS